MNYALTHIVNFFTGSRDDSDAIISGESDVESDQNDYELVSSEEDVDPVCIC